MAAATRRLFLFVDDEADGAEDKAVGFEVYVLRQEYFGSFGGVKISGGIGGVDGNEILFALGCSFEYERIGGKKDLKLAFGMEGGDGAVELDELLYKIEDRIGIVYLICDSGCALTVVGGKIRSIAFGKAVVLLIVPLHGGSGTGSDISAFLGGQTLEIIHSYFVTVINEGNTGHGEQEHQCRLELIRVSHICQALHIVVTGDHADIALATGVFEVEEVSVQILVDVTLALS